MKNSLLLSALLVLTGCASTVSSGMTAHTMNDSAEEYVKLVLSLGEHDADYVDAYYGPAAIREAVKADKPSLTEIHTRAVSLRNALAADPEPADAMLALRRQYLIRQTEALIARTEMLQGRKFTFDEESKALYDAVAPSHSEDYFRQLTAELDRELPGEGPLIERLEDFRREFTIPSEKLDAVFRAAVDGCRARTAAHLTLPGDETFTIEYVKDKAWSGYNWYQGNFNSLIQVNTDLPIFIDRAIDLACHEGYPGHHAYNVMLEKHLVRDRGWPEFTVYPLFSPQSLIAEGSANYGIDVAFPANERLEFEKRVLFPLAGIDPARAEKYYRVQELTSKTSYAGNEAARRYLNGEITATQAAEWLTKYGLMSPERAQQRVKFIDKYRSYVINYNLGRDLVAAYVERESGGDPEKRWKVFGDLISSPRLPSGLR